MTFFSVASRSRVGLAHPNVNPGYEAAATSAAQGCDFELDACRYLERLHLEVGVLQVRVVDQHLERAGAQLKGASQAWTLEWI